MLRRILLAAIPAGVIAGTALTAAQIPYVIPLIHQAEGLERHADAPPPASASETGASSPAIRLAYTTLGNLLIGIAGGLLIAGGMALRGATSDARSGMLWGLAGFAAFALAPALGLPPELPGTQAATLGARQGWWAFTVAATAGGLALVILSEKPRGTLLGCALLALPHVVGAPRALAPGSAVPEALERQFITASLLATFLYWIVLGAAAGFLYGRLGERGSAQAPGSP